MATESTERARHRVRHGWVVAWTLVGVAMLVAAACAADYWRDLLLGLGTTFFLLAIVVVAERNLVTIVEGTRGPRTLAAAQGDLASLLSSARQREGSRATGATVAAARTATVRAAAQQLATAGLLQQPAGAGEIVMEDEAGLGIRWVISWNRESLAHRLTLQSDDAPVSVMETGYDLPEGPLTEDAQRTLHEFDGDLFRGLRELVLVLLPDTRPTA